MEDTLHIAGAQGRPDSPVGYRAPGGAIWIFAGADYRPTFLLALRRRSPDGLSLRREIWEMPRGTQERLVAQVGDLDPFDVAEWEDDDLQDHLEWMVEAARLKLYRLDADEAFRLKDVDDPLFQHPDLPDALPENAAPTALLRQRRLQLAEELGDQLIRRWMSKDAADGTFWEDPGWRGDLLRATIVTGGMFQAAGDGVLAFAKGIDALFEALWKVGKVVVTATGDAIRFTAEFVDNLSEGDIAEAAAQLNRIGVKIRNGLNDIKKLVADGIKWLNLLNEDAQSRRILANYFIGLKGSISDVDRATLPVRVVTEFGLEVILTIAVGVVTGGVGAVVNVARKIGHFAGRAIELVIDIIKLLRKVAAGKADDVLPRSRRRADGPDPEPVTIGDPRLMRRGRNPHPGLHNRQWREIEVEKFRTRRPVVMDDLSETERLAVRHLEQNGWTEEKVEEILASGRGFRTKDYQPGDRLYGFTSQGFAKDIDRSPYWLDEEGFEALAAKHYRDGAWDREAVKNELALPCYNRADAIDVAEVTEPQTAVESTIGRATELISYTDDAGSTGLMPKLMSGGGRQIAPDPSRLKSIVSQTP